MIPLGKSQVLSEQSSKTEIMTKKKIKKNTRLLPDWTLNVLPEEVYFLFLIYSDYCSLSRLLCTYILFSESS